MPDKKHINFLLFALLFVGVFALFGAGGTNIEASSTDNLSGYAWSETTGWISFNCTNAGTCGTSNYGVTAAASGALSGYAWAETIGWISFNPTDTAGCPSSPCLAKFDYVTGAVTGWARALAQTAGFDGWIHLSGANYGVGAYDIDGDGNGCEWSGYAWGSDVIGWVHFAGTNYGVLGAGDACTENPIDPPDGGGGGGDPLSATCAPSPTSAQTNEPITWTAAVSGGSGAYAYLWSGNPPLNGKSNNPVTILYSSEGTKTGGVTVSSGVENVTVDCSPDVTIAGEGELPPPPISVSCSPSKINVAIDEPLSWTANVTGGAGNYAFEWSGEIPLEQRTTNPVNLSYGTSGTKTGGVTVSSGLFAESAECSPDVAVAGVPPPPEGENPEAELLVAVVPTSVLSGGTINVYWDTNHARDCIITGSNGDNWSGNSGVETSSPITGTTVYTLQCRDEDGNWVTDQATIILSPRFEEF